MIGTALLAKRKIREKRKREKRGIAQQGTKEEDNKKEMERRREEREERAGEWRRYITGSFEYGWNGRTQETYPEAARASRGTGPDKLHD